MWSFVSYNTGAIAGQQMSAVAQKTEKSATNKRAATTCGVRLSGWLTTIALFLPVSVHRKLLKRRSLIVILNDHYERVMRRLAQGKPV